MNAYVLALIAILAVAAAAWVVSILIRNVSFVDSLWSLFFLLAAAVLLLSVNEPAPRAYLVAALVALWSIRLSVHITVRNWGEGEDYRYRTIRANNDPGFAVKSLYIVFGLQGLLAWIVAAPLWPAITAPIAINGLDVLALALWALGFFFEAVGDYQLVKFKADPANAGKVMDRGLWRYTRHPNYFGDCCIWWAFYLFAVAAGGWWTIFAPLLMTLLLLRVSGVAMLERTITDRRPGYVDYVERTNAFVPGPVRDKASKEVLGL